MYDRSRRFVTPDPVTGPFISPNTYHPYNGHDVSGRPCVSSFMATSNRDSFLQKHRNPPVGRYNVKHPKIKVHGCCTVRNQAKRYVWTQDRNPSPCRYDTSDIQVISGRIKKMGRFEKNIFFPNTKTRLPSLGHVTIPDTGNRFWNEDERTGQLVRMPPPDADRTLGPAFYHVKEDFKVDRIKDSHWGNRTAFRKLILSGIEGTHTIYDVRQRPLKKRKTPRCLTNQRYMSAHTQQCYKDDYPGVGTYEVLLTQDPLQLRPLLGPDGDRVVHAPFMQSEGLHRRISSQLALPGPGDYAIPSNTIKVTFNRRPPPFNIVDSRVRIIAMPSIDAMYDMTGISEKMATEIQRTKSLRPGFNVCSRRFPKPKKKDNRSMPGFLNPPAPKIPLPSAAFKSRRNECVSAATEDTPDPTRYNVIQSFKASQEKKKPAPGFTSQEFHQKGIGFWSGARCFQDRQEVKNATFPGPGSFDLSGNVLTGIGKFCFQEARFKEKLEITPGPGEYEVGPDIAENTIPGTHNTTLANPQLYVRPKYFRVRPENIPISYFRSLSNARGDSIKKHRELDNWVQDARRSIPLFACPERLPPQDRQREVPKPDPSRPKAKTFKPKPKQGHEAEQMHPPLPSPAPDIF